MADDKRRFQSTQELAFARMFGGRSKTNYRGDPWTNGKVPAGGNQRLGNQVAASTVCGPGGDVIANCFTQLTDAAWVDAAGRLSEPLALVHHHATTHSACGFVSCHLHFLSLVELHTS
jgi:hypothetical protein